MKQTTEQFKEVFNVEKLKTIFYIFFYLRSFFAFAYFFFFNFSLALQKYPFNDVLTQEFHVFFSLPFTKHNKITNRGGKNKTFFNWKN
jgi:hypothetical protein